MWHVPLLLYELAASGREITGRYFSGKFLRSTQRDRPLWLTWVIATGAAMVLGPIRRRIPLDVLGSFPDGDPHFEPPSSYAAFLDASDNFSTMPLYQELLCTSGSGIPTSVHSGQDRVGNPKVIVIERCKFHTLYYT
jgi:hypothetical protein